MTANVIPDEIDDDEKIGRGVFYSKWENKTNLRRAFYYDTLKAQSMSVDRLDYASLSYGISLKQLSQVHILAGQNRNPPRNFYGWYEFEAKVIRITSSLCIKYKYQSNNLTHSEVMKVGALSDEDLKTECDRLASASSWVDCP